MWGWYRAIDRAISWCLSLPERAARKPFVWIMSRLYPELNRVADEDERLCVSMVAGLSEPRPRWQGCLFAAAVCVIFPTVGAVAALIIAHGLGLRLDSGPLVFVFLGGWIGGAILAITAWCLLRLRHMREAHIKTLRNVGYDLCHRCHYDLSGHPPEPGQPRTCPECGATITPDP